MKRLRSLVAFAAGLLMCVAPVLGAQKAFISVPAIDLDALLPYVQSNLLFVPRQDDFLIQITSIQSAPPKVQEYRADIDEFAKVFLWELIHRRGKVYKAVREVKTTVAQESPPEVATVSCNSNCWNQLLANPNFLPELEAAFMRAKAKGRLRCRLCENQFVPEALVLLE